MERTPILIDFYKGNTHHVEGYVYEPNWKKVPLDKANAWSSQCRYFPDVHLPVFDVDVDPESQHFTQSVKMDITGIEGFYYLPPECCPVWEVVEQTFPDANIDWVPSTTAGHYHVYIDDCPLLWSEYKGKLLHLADRGIVEVGYVAASIREGSTHVRMPHVKKQAIYPAPIPEWPGIDTTVPTISYPYDNDPF